MHELKVPFVSRIEFIRSKLSNFSAHVSGILTGHDRVGLGQPTEHVLDEAHLHAGLHVPHRLAQDAREHAPDLRLGAEGRAERVEWGSGRSR